MCDKLTIVEQKEVTFYEDELTAVRSDDGQVYVSLPSLCDSLGIQTSAQTKRIKRHDVLADGYEVVSVTYSSILDEQPDQRRLAGVLRVDLVPLWLTGLSVKASSPKCNLK
ncbi:MAG: phage antirepressor N-terminal domain-containing protein [Chloroflexi bacterium]|nr:phage antirepressor N-terminal domain-containing protein [Chloroflexota bacterium]